MAVVSRALSALAFAALFPSCTSSQSAPVNPSCILVEAGFGPKGALNVRAETVVTGLEVPWGIAFLPGGDLLVTERPGRVRLVRGATLLPPVANFAIGQKGEGGLLGIAAHPDFASTRSFYVYLTGTSRGALENRVERWKLAPNGLSATFDTIILDNIPAAQYHDGGRIRFGPDGMLYIGTGDGGRPDLAQSLDSLAGKLLRLTPDGAIPADNPFPGRSVFLLGIRNTQGFDWRDASTLYVTDHGPSGDTGRRGHDEVNVATAGANLGWPTIYSCESASGRVTPSLTWEQAMPPGGAAVYTGAAIPEWRGDLLVGSLGAAHLHRIVFDATVPQRVTQHEVYFEGEPPSGFGRLREVIMGPDRQLYVTTSNCDGRGDCPPEKDRILTITR